MINPDKHFNFFFFLMIVLSGLTGQGTLFAQNGVSLDVEIRNIEAAAARQGIPQAERHDALVRLARLRQLTGDIESAARNWLDAVTAVSGQIDDNALLSCAYCLAAMGEWDRALTALEPLLSKSIRARFLDASIKAINTGDLYGLGVLADNPDYSEIKNEIIFILWRLSNGNASERWRRRLIDEFPQTPEGRLASGVDSSAIIVRPSPFWFFAGGLDSLALMEGISRPASRPAQTVPAQAPAPAASAQASPAPTAPVQSTITPPQTAAVQPARLQTGIFSREVNARAQSDALRQAGFSSTIEPRTVNNNEMWAVTVPAGSDASRTANALRTAGFESFPVR